MNRNLVGSTYGRLCIKFPQSRMKGERHRPTEPLVFMAADWFFLGQISHVHLTFLFCFSGVEDRLFVSIPVFYFLLT